MIILFFLSLKMTVITKDIPQTEKLLKLVPDNVYTKDTPYLARQVVKISSDNMSGISTTFPATNILKFTIAPTTSNLINLSESYLNIAGVMYMYDKSDKPLKNKGVNLTSDAIVPPYFWMPMFDKVTLYISGTVVYDIVSPMNLVNFYTSHYKSHTDRQNRNLEDIGIYPIYFTNPSTELVGLTTTAGQSLTTPWMYNLQVVDEGKDGNDIINFQLQIKLSDIFPGVDSIKPIYGNSVICEFQMASKGFTSIRGTKIDDDKLKYCLINNFEQFNLNVVSYQLDSNMVEKMNQIYGKGEIISIIDDIQYFNNSLMSLGSTSTFELKIPLNLKFSSDLINISFPQATANNYNVYGDWSDSMFYLNHCKCDNRLYPITRVSVYADNVLLYNRNYQTSNVPFPTRLNDNPLLYSLHNAEANNYGFKMFDYTILYKEYKESRYCTYENEHNAIPIMEWINDYFSINIPTSAFTKLSTESNVILQIVFGTGIQDTPKANPGYINALTTDANSQILTQIKVIQKSKKALVFKGFNQTEVRTVTQSFSNDISIENLNDAQKN